MHEKTLLVTALIVTFGGLCVLAVFSSFAGQEGAEKWKEVGTLEGEGTYGGGDGAGLSSRDFQEGNVVVRGEVERIAVKEKVAFIDVLQPTAVHVVVFLKENITLAPGERVAVYGERKEYQGKEEIIGHEIRRLDS